jgi:hypothetical protein
MKNLEERAAGAQELPISRYIVKELPLVYRNQSLGTLFLRANTLTSRLTRREEYFLTALNRILCLALYHLKKNG